MSSILQAAKRNAEAAKNAPKPERALARPQTDVSGLNAYQAAKKIAASAKAEKR